MEARDGMENLGDEGGGSSAEPPCIVDGKIVVEDVGVQVGECAQDVLLCSLDSSYT